MVFLDFLDFLFLVFRFPPFTSAGSCGSNSFGFDGGGGVCKYSSFDSLTTFFGNDFGSPTPIGPSGRPSSGISIKSISSFKFLISIGSDFGSNVGSDFGSNFGSDVGGSDFGDDLGSHIATTSVCPF